MEKKIVLFCFLLNLITIPSIKAQENLSTDQLIPKIDFGIINEEVLPNNTSSTVNIIASSTAVVEFSGTITLATPPVIGTITQATCAVQTGSVVLEGLPSVGTWTLTRYPGAINSTGTGTSTTVADLPPGTYTFTVTEASGTPSDPSAEVIIIQPELPSTPVATITQPTCSVLTGTVEVTSPVGAIEYSIDGVTWQTGVDFNGIASGNYTL